MTPVTYAQYQRKLPVRTPGQKKRATHQSTSIITPTQPKYL
ncbi:MAG: hypothetical protein ABJB86_10250 [Bacteroidota bacterium]